MTERFLVFADPPHPNPDLKAIAAVLGVLPVEVRGKLGYPSPEPWLVTDEAAARAASEKLGAAGVRTALVAASALAAVPVADDVKEFTLTGQGIEWTTRGGAGAKARSGALAWSEVKVALSYRRTIETETGGGEKGEKPRGLGATKFMANMVLPVVGGAIVGKLAGQGGGKQAPRVHTTFEESLELGGVAPEGPHRAR